MIPPAGDGGADPADEAGPTPGRRGPKKRRPSDEADTGARPGAIPEILRRAMALGLTGFFSTEEAIRRALGDTLPQEWVDFASAQSERTRSEVTQRMAEEFGRVIEQIEVAEVLERLLEGRTVEISASIRLGPREPASEDGDRPGSGGISVRWVDPKKGRR